MVNDKAFRIGEKVKVLDKYVGIVSKYSLDDNTYYIKMIYEEEYSICGWFNEHDIKSFNESTEKHYSVHPYDKVLVRNDVGEKWKPTLYGYYNDKDGLVYDIAQNGWFFCIPYKGNEERLGDTI